MIYYETDTDIYPPFAYIYKKCIRESFAFVSRLFAKVTRLFAKVSR